ncbi:inosose dehydratase [Clostridium algifaecis]|uniref:Inosose dehydratase n=1 Tax=Clostridium algifaecis TaxID=1472040 RepID=A0ABS4KS08_9CLOT|nr:sugar phosphate isomerase/epimerase [Clostridium algifaecis]MBP2032824.1 inosose dehydratase [Clostridium algifaecis]
MTIKIGTAPDSWGVWFPDNNKQVSWERCMDEMQKAGYEYVELGPWGYFPTDYESLNAELEKRKLKLVAGTVGGNYVDDASIDNMFKTIDELAPLLKKFPTAKYVVMLADMYTDLMTGKLAMPKKLTEDQWNQLYKNVQRVCDHIRSYGLVPAFHPHVDSYIQTEEEIERLLANTDATLCLDTGHHVYGGGEPISFYKKHYKRIPYLHIKKCDMNVKKEMDKNGWSFAKAVTKDIMCEPGKGSIDFKELFDFMNKIGYDGYAVVEQDLYPVLSFDVPFPIAKRTRDYLKSLGV